MAIIPQMSLFTWKEIEILGDLDRLRLVLDYMPDEAFMQSLEKKRGRAVMTTPFVPCGILSWQALYFNMKALRNYAVNSPVMAN
ncbi:hypothetical protein [Heyndrickxia coagulans]|uniref:hypothetical protein n=1 Tax=Heyndrickxia coagulans TaxID=1398 RepID=UPI001F26A478|nr:hypothetical protein [Heyndrickxia coagulans]